MNESNKGYKFKFEIEVIVKRIQIPSIDLQHMATQQKKRYKTMNN